MKIFPSLNTLLPRSLFGRTLLILLLPTLLVQAVTTYIFYDRHWDHVSRNMALSLAGEIAMLVDEIHATGYTNFSPRGHKAKQFMNLDLEFAKTKKHDPKKLKPLDVPSFMKELGQRIKEPFLIYEEPGGDDLLVVISFEEGYLTVRTSRKRLVSSTTYIFILWMSGAAVLFTGLSIYFLRGQLRPLSVLAQAADDFGRGMDSPDFRPRGALEIRHAATAFLTMRDRIQRFVTQRTGMLSAISHDLRSPLTRMKLRLAMMPASPDRDALTEDVSHMEHMVAEYLQFARGEGTEAPQAVRLDLLLLEMAEGYAATGGDVTLHTPPVCSATLRPQAFRRALGNLIDNALTYGNRVELALALEPHTISITVDDNGPGIAPGLREQAFKPFERLNAARTPGHGGASVGLGLTIARDICAAHGAMLLLEDAPLGGLRARIRLPR
ncbi:MAG: HAMP domain-containing protein [Alphaproteobacteria bacterium]|nr:HAMP domain-containing protein [Alphaproteobacteria bacterium]